MTTVAALTRDGTVYMAADSQTNIYDRPVYTADKIIHRVVDDRVLLLGVAGDGAIAPLLRYDWQIPPYGEDTNTWLHRVITSITDLCVERNIGLDNGYLTTAVLIGWDGKLYHGTHHQVIEPDGNCAAIGRGEEPAMATMLALQDHTNLDPVTILDRAIGYAARLANGTGGPVRHAQTHQQARDARRAARGD